MSSHYISINNRPILGIYQPFNNIFLSQLRILSNEIGIGKLYLIEINKRNEISPLRNIFDGFTEIKEFPSKSLFINESLKSVYYFNYYHDLKKNQNTSENEFYNLNILECSSPEKFYLISKFIINLAKNKKRNNFILVNAWNNYEENYILEYNKKHGYSYLNSLS